MLHAVRGRASPAAHALPLLSFAALAILFTWPLATRLDDVVIGAGAGDNFGALWNVWWARQAIHGGGTLFWTPALFAPLGTSLVLHSFAPLESAAAGVLPVDVVSAYNLSLIAAVFLNLACGYLACWSVTGDARASCFGAIAFGGAPFLLVRLHGHLNVLNAWGLPLLVVAARRYRNAPTYSAAAILAATLAVLAYTDAYFAIFGVVLLFSYLAFTFRPVRLRPTPLTTTRRRGLRVLLGLIVIVFAAILWIEATGGADTVLAGVRLRMTDSFNPRVILGFLLVAAAVTWMGPAVELDRPRVSSVLWRRLPAALGMAALLMLPLVVAAIQLWRAGDYESQVYFWRSAPPGIDLAAMVLGNPLGVLTGSWSGAAYQRLGIDRFESAAWLGIASLAVIGSGLGRLRATIEGRAFLWIGAIFVLWSLGPYLRLFGSNTAFMLPQTFMRFVPIVANARIPGRAFVVVLLMSAMLGALALSTLGQRRRNILAFVAIAAIVADFWPAAHAWTALDRPGIYGALRAQPSGIVLEVPLGLRDGFGERGRLDHRALYYQTVHAHPLMGGFAARLSSRIKRAYDNDPVLGPLLDLSEPAGSRSAPRAAPPQSPDSPPRCVLTCTVRYVVVDEATASPALVDFVRHAFALRTVGRSGARVLYAVE